jgi:DNA-binding transcriptional regulator LsrR (DeoR family)
MPGPRNVETLVEVAHRYYIGNESQQDIAHSIGSTRSNVSRMLAAARERGIVRIEVARPPDRDEHAERLLVRRFGLRQAVVHGGEDRSMRSVARLAADWLLDEVEDGMRVAMSWGRSLSAIVRSISGTHNLDVEVVQAGGDLQLTPQFSGHELVRGLAERLGGTYSYLHAPAIVDAPSTVRELRRTRSIATQLEKARTADLALVGIGGFGTGFAAQLLSSSHLQPEEREAFDAIAPVGDILARFFDENGRQIETPLRDRVLALELEELADVATTVGIAQGASKARGVLGALRGRLIDVLVTDSDTATAVLTLDDAGVLA